MLKKKKTTTEKQKVYHFFYSAGVYLEAAKNRKDFVSDCTTKNLIS